MKNVRIYMLGYKSGSGKDTLAKYLIDNNNFVRVAFADKLKEVVADLFSLSNDQVFGDNKNTPDIRYAKDPAKLFKDHMLNGMFGLGAGAQEKNFTPRELLQEVGNGLRNVYESVWAEYVANSKIPALIAQGHTKFVITDFRFPNEYEVVKAACEKNGWDYDAVRIDRDIDRNFAGANNISETALDNWNKWNIILKNNDTPETLYNNFSSNFL